MKYVDEYRGEAEARAYADAIRRRVTRPWTVMEICGGQTHSIMKYGLDQLLPPEVSLVHGPGCPVCVTPVELIDRAIAIAVRPGVVLASFGDMLRVPGSSTDLLAAKSAGADVRMVYSALDAVKIAATDRHREVVFFAVGFETTAPGSAIAVIKADRLGLGNFTILSSHVLVPPAMEALLGAADNVVQGFLAAGHVCAVMGYREYEPIAERYRVPIVPTGFEPLDLLQGLHMLLAMLEEGRIGVENQYARSVTRDGNPHAQRLLAEVFEPCDRKWRGIGEIPGSGYRLRSRYRRFDAEERFDVGRLTAREPESCIAGAILKGLAKPPSCTEFGRGCTPEHPLGAPMVSSEGACAAYFRYGRASVS
ncbi:MAG: hydrogenase formation protein HypD [Polyangiaceae bacterium]|nr:hydrogenase formation protein HypD [Polyangiaceae bacterium]